MHIFLILILSDGQQKIEMYKRFRGVNELEDIKELQEEMIDRFGEYPDEVSYLFQIAEIKVFALLIGVESIKQVKDEVTILLSEDTSESYRWSEGIQINESVWTNGWSWNGRKKVKNCSSCKER